jgi:gas vesicle protein
MNQSNSDGGARNFITGLIVGFFVSLPVAAWLSPRSGPEARDAIRQQGRIVRRQAAEVIRKPVEGLQEKVEQIKGESVDDALAEGKALARQRQEEGNGA